MSKFKQFLFVCFRPVIVLLILFCLYDVVFSQDNQGPSVNPKDPNELQLSENIMSLNNRPSSQFGKPALGSSDLYTGMATYQIPLFELKSYNLKVPVSINYASGGIRVGDTGGWLGMTWQLSAGGEISREMNSYPDELPGKGYFDYGEMAKTFESKSNDQRIDIINKSQEDGYDFQPDLFHYSFGGETGYFVFDNDQNIHLVPFKNWKVNKTISGNKITSFSILTDNGTKYTFGLNSDAIEETKISTLNSSPYWDFSTEDYKVEFNDGALKEKILIDDFYNSKWYLTEVLSPVNDKMSFEYDDAGMVSYVNAPQVMSYELVTELLPYNNKMVTPHLIAYKRINPRVTDTDNQCNLVSLQNCPLNCPSDGDFETYEDGIFNYLKGCINPSIEAAIPVPVRYYINQSKVEIKSKIIKKIKASNNAYILISHDPANTLPGLCKINKISLFDFNSKEIKSFSLQYKKVVSLSYDPSGAYDDPFSPLEYHVFENSNIPKPDSHFVPANLAEGYFESVQSQHDELYSKYIFEGLKSYNYERYFLEKLTEIHDYNKIPSYDFSYVTPEKIIRRTSLLTSNFNFSADNPDLSSQLYFKILESKNYQITDGLNRHSGTSYGQLEKVELPTGGYFKYSWQPTGMGPMRVNEIIQNDGQNFLKKLIIYNDDSTKCHKALPIYSKDYDWFDGHDLVVYRSTVKTSYEMFDVDLTKGSPVGYSSVQVKNCKNDDSAENIGYEEYEFTKLDSKQFTGLVDNIWTGKAYSNANIEGFDAVCKSFRISLNQWINRFERTPYPDLKAFEEYDYIHFCSLDYARGLLKSVSTHSNTGIVSSVTNEYKYTEYSHVYGLRGLTYNAGRFELIENPTCLFCIEDVMAPHEIKRNVAYLSLYRSSSVFLTSSTEKTYDNNGNEIAVKKEITTSPTFLKPIEAKSYAIDASEQKYGDEQMTKYRYTNEFTLNNDMKALIDKNIFIPIEVINYTNNKVVGATVTKYFNSNGLILPNKSYALETNQALSNYVPALFLTNDVYTGCQLKVTYDKYDDKGNLLQYHPENGNYTSYLWAYNKSYPVAKIENSTYLNVENMLTTIGSSFDDIEAKSVGSSDEMDLIQLFNALRKASYMRDALITSYTYDPLIGIRSETDPSGKTTYYEYDELGRLTLVRDQNNNIVKTYDYHYKAN